MPTLIISCQTGTNLDLDQIEPYQGGLKELSQSDYVRLRAQIEALGYTFAAQVWARPDGGFSTLDGHQRLRVIRQMRDDGWTIPPLPVALVYCRDEREADAKVLASVSQYGKVTHDSLYEFLQHRDIDIESVIALNSIPDTDIYAFKAEYYEDSKPAPTIDDEKPEVCDLCGAKKRKKKRSR